MAKMNSAATNEKKVINGNDDGHYVEGDGHKKKTDEETVQKDFEELGRTYYSNEPFFAVT